MDVKNAKKGKQRKFVNKEVKELDEEPLAGEISLERLWIHLKLEPDRTSSNWGI